MNDKTMIDKTTIREQLDKGKPVITYTSGRSMEPLLYEHETYVVIQSIPMLVGKKAELRIGELPIYLRPDGKYVIHRIIAITEDCYITRGDHCITSEKVPKEWVLGVVRQINRKGHLIQVTDRGYRLYVWFWIVNYPLRWCWFQLKRAGRKLFAVVKKD